MLSTTTSVAPTTTKPLFCCCCCCWHVFRQNMEPEGNSGEEGCCCCHWFQHQQGRTLTYEQRNIFQPSCKYLQSKNWGNDNVRPNASIRQSKEGEYLAAQKIFIYSKTPNQCGCCTKVLSGNNELWPNKLQLRPHIVFFDWNSCLSFNS